MDRPDATAEVAVLAGNGRASVGAQWYEPQPTAPPGNPIADDLPGCEPQQISFADEMARNDAFNDLVDLFLARRSSHDDDIFCRDVCYSLLQESTRTYLRSLNQQRAMSHSSLE